MEHQSRGHTEARPSWHCPLRAQHGHISLQRGSWAGGSSPSLEGKHRVENKAALGNSVFFCLVCVFLPQLPLPGLVLDG